MSGLRGELATLTRFSASLRRLPIAVANKVAAAAAPVITALGKQTFDASQDAYGASWKPGAEGQRITLRQTGALAKFIKYIAIGTKLRVSLGVPYAKYQIGKRPVYPRGELPSAYQRELARLAVQIVKDEIEGAP